MKLKYFLWFTWCVVLASALSVFAASTYFKPELVNAETIDPYTGTFSISTANKRAVTETLITSSISQIEIESNRLNNLEELNLSKYFRIRQSINKNFDFNENYGVYFYDLDNNVSVYFNKYKVLAPASIAKLPVAILTLKDAEEGKVNLKENVEIEWSDWANPSNKLTAWNVGDKYKISDLIQYLIVDSDNTSWLKLENLQGGVDEVNKRTREELGLNPFFRQPHQSTAEEIGKVFKGIYNQEYLSERHNKILLNHLLNTSPLTQDGILEKLPEDIKVAHKTGQIPDPEYDVWNDAAIVYTEDADYVLVVINEFIQLEDARPKIQNLSKEIYKIVTQD